MLLRTQLTLVTPKVPGSRCAPPGTRASRQGLKGVVLQRSRYHGLGAWQCEQSFTMLFKHTYQSLFSWHNVQTLLTSFLARDQDYYFWLVFSQASAECFERCQLPMPFSLPCLDEGVLLNSMLTHQVVPFAHSPQEWVCLHSPQECVQRQTLCLDSSGVLLQLSLGRTLSSFSQPWSVWSLIHQSSVPAPFSCAYWQIERVSGSSGSGPRISIILLTSHIFLFFFPPLWELNAFIAGIATSFVTLAMGMKTRSRDSCGLLNY